MVLETNIGGGDGGIGGGGGSSGSAGANGTAGANATVIITGGSINATIPGSPANGDNGNENVSLITVETDVPDAEIESGMVTGAEYYSFEGVKTDENGKLYLWLPAGTTEISVTIDGIVYSITL